MKTEIKDFQSYFLKFLKEYPFTKIKTKHIKLCKSLFDKGYSIQETVNHILLNP